MKKVEATILIKTQTKDIINAFTQFSHLKKWWGVEKCLIEPKNKGVYTLAWLVSENGMKYISTGLIEKYDPSGGELEIKNFVYLNPERSFLGPMSLTVKAKSHDDISAVYLCQSGYQEGGDWDWYYNAVKEAWPIVLKELKKYLESR